MLTKKKKTTQDNGVFDGYDMRDFLLQNRGVDVIDLIKARGRKPKAKKKKKKVEEYDENATIESELTTIEPLECTKFDELITHYKTELYVPLRFEQAIAVVFATVMSTELPKSQLWFRLIGPPGSGKSTIAELISVDKDHIFPRSRITGFHSGHGDSRKRSSSLIPYLRNKTWVNKDADVLMQSSGRAEIQAELRDIYDRISRAHFRTGRKELHRDIAVTVILCGTDSLRLMDDPILGTRWLDIETFDDGIENKKNLLGSVVDSFYNSLDKAFEEKDSEDDGEYYKLKRYTLGFIQHKKETLRTYKIKRPAKTIIAKIQRYGEFLAALRTSVHRERSDELKIRPREELPTRLTEQFLKLLTSLAFVTDRSYTDCLPIVRQVLLDSSKGFKLETIQLLYTQDQNTQKLANMLSMSVTHIRRLLDDLREVKIIERKEVTDGSKGRSYFVFSLTDRLNAIIKEGRIFHASTK